MAVEPRRGEVTRDQVQGWINGYKSRTADYKASTTLEQYITAKFNGLDLEDDEIITEGHQDLEDITPMLQMILNDLPSYNL